MSRILLSNDQTKVETTQKNQNNVPSKNVSLDVTTDVTAAVDKTANAVVGITNIQTASFWNTTESQEAGVGSGVMYKKAGDTVYIVTNHHVVEGATQLEVTLPDGTKLPAELRGSDVWTDLAVVEVDAKDIKDETISEFGDSDALKIGEPVIAIGNPLGLQFFWFCYARDYFRSQSFLVLLRKGLFQESIEQFQLILIKTEFLIGKQR